MIDKTSSLPNVFKGIALLTPGGDLIYGVNPNKKAQWHSDLCAEMQRIWGLSDSPHFLVPGYTATVERWFNPHSGQIETLAEVYPPVERYIPLLQTLFNIDETKRWHIAPWQEQHCNRAIIETYKPNFARLWEQRDLIVRLRHDHLTSPTMLSNNSQDSGIDLVSTSISSDINSGYVLHLFIKGDRPSVEKTLSSTHQLLEHGLDNPYTLKVIDIDKNPQQAADNQITITPTLVRISPKPIRRVIGELDDIQRVLNIITSFS